MAARKSLTTPLSYSMVLKAAVEPEMNRVKQALAPPRCCALSGHHREVRSRYIGAGRGFYLETERLHCKHLRLVKS